jgi:cation diffusion facilitator family transporter
MLRHSLFPKEKQMAASKRTVYIALSADVVIAITKFIAAFFSHSSAMISEGIHSTIDSVTQILLLVGIKKSRKPADEQRPFGYGKELYFWSFVVSMMLFFTGGVVSFYTGIIHLQHPAKFGNLTWNYVVLGVAFVFNCVSIIQPIKAFNQERKDNSVWDALKKSKDPATFVVLLEDFAGLLGVLIAFSGIFLGHLFGKPYSMLSPHSLLV